LIKFDEGLCDKLGKTCIRVKDIPGDTSFGGNPIFTAARIKAPKIIDEGIATAEDIDTVMMGGFNWPAGPIRTGAGARASWGQKK